MEEKKDKNILESLNNDGILNHIFEAHSSSILTTFMLAILLKEIDREGLADDIMESFKIFSDNIHQAQEALGRHMGRKLKEVEVEKIKEKITNKKAKEEQRFNAPNPFGISLPRIQCKEE